MEPREKLTQEDFEVAQGEVFDPTAWLNSRLERGRVTLDKLDNVLSNLGMSCQLLCQDTSDSIEVASNQLVAQLPTAARDLERMHQEAKRGYERVTVVLEGMKDTDERKKSGLQTLAEIDIVKTRVETVFSALREVGSWERKVRECEHMVHNGGLTTALAQLIALKGVLDAFRMLPEYGRKEEQLNQLEEQLLSTARRKARQAIDRNAVPDLRACGEVFTGMHRHAEVALIANSTIMEFTDRAWQTQEPKRDFSATAYSEAAKAAFAALAQGIEERWALLESLEPGEHAQEAAGKEHTPHPSGVAVAAVRAALGAIGHKVEKVLTTAASAGAKEASELRGAEGASVSTHVRASCAVALLATYVDGFATLASCGPLAGLWAQVCKVDIDQVDIVPWLLLKEAVRFVVWRPMQDDATALAPAVHSQLRPSEAVLSAESGAARLLQQLPAIWARKLEQHGGSQLAVPWLACVDETLAAFWQSWDQLMDTFRNTLELSRPGEAADGGLLTECMQLYALLHDLVAKQLAACQLETLQLAVRMNVSDTSPFSVAVAHKLQDLDSWSERVGLPSVAALRAAASAVEGLAPDSPSLPSRARTTLPSTCAALATAERKVQALVIHCCVQPVTVILTSYSEMKEWAEPEEPDAFVPGGLLPLACITAVGEHLFSLVPLLERSQDTAEQWLPMILEAMVELVARKVLAIKKLTSLGATQLIVDLEYLQKLTDALGHGASDSDGGSASAQLRELIEVLSFLFAQYRRRAECSAKNEPFAEEAKEGPPCNRNVERAFRAAFGL